MKFFLRDTSLEKNLKSHYWSISAREIYKDGRQFNNEQIHVLPKKKPNTMITIALFLYSLFPVIVVEIHQLYHIVDHIFPNYYKSNMTAMKICYIILTIFSSRCSVNMRNMPKRRDNLLPVRSNFSNWTLKNIGWINEEKKMRAYK